MKDITIIVPIHKYSEDIEKLLKNAVDSIQNKEREVIFVGPKEILEKTSKIYPNATQVINEECDFFTQINKAVLQCVTPYFSILEFDDKYLNKWDEVIESALDDTTNSIIIPLNEYYKDGKFVAFGNEIAWDASFIGEGTDGESRELGYLTEDELKVFNDFNLTGAVFKTEDFISVGSLKPEFKVTAWFEFLMRLVRSNKKVYVLPRVLYQHTVMREDSFMVNAKNLTTPEEVEEFFKEIIGE